MNTTTDYHSDITTTTTTATYLIIHSIVTLKLITYSPM